MNAQREQWAQWLAEFKQRFIATKGWTDKEAKLRIRDAWAIVRNGRVHTLAGGNQPLADALPVFEMRSHGGWKLPIEIIDQLTGVIAKAMTSQRSPRDIVMALVELARHSDGQDEDAETRQKRNKADFWVWQLLDACEDKALAGVIGSDVFWQAILSALEAGRSLTILEEHHDPQLLADLIKSQSFQSGRSPDELSRCLEASFLDRRAVLGRDPKPQEVAEAAGGTWSKIDACWQFDKRLISHGALCQRLKDIRHRRP